MASEAGPKAFPLDLCAILRECRESGVARIKLPDGTEVEFGEVKPAKKRASHAETADGARKAKEEAEREGVREVTDNREEEMIQALLENPALAEELYKQHLGTPEVIDAHIQSE